jgi:hypothetical protein
MLIPIRSLSNDIDNNGLLANTFSFSYHSRLPADIFSLFVASFSFTGRTKRNKVVLFQLIM